MTSRLPTLLLLAVALFTGFVPLRRCDATDGGGGVVPLGQHGHSHDAAEDPSDSAHARCAHGTPATRAHAHEACRHEVCGCDRGDGAPATHDRCCTDTPFDAGPASASVALAPPALLPPTAWAVEGAATDRAPTPRRARPDEPPDSLRSVRTTVLLR